MAVDFGMVLTFFVGLYAYVGSWLPWWWVWVHCGIMVVAMDFGIGFDCFLGFCAFTGSWWWRRGVSVVLGVGLWWWKWILGWVLPSGFRFCGFLL